MNPERKRWSLGTSNFLLDKYLLISFLEHYSNLDFALGIEQKVRQFVFCFFPSDYNWILRVNAIHN